MTVRGLLPIQVRNFPAIYVLTWTYGAESFLRCRFATLYGQTLRKVSALSVFRAKILALKQNSALAEKWAYVFNNIAELKSVPDELSEKYFRKLFETAKIVNFTDVEQVSYVKDQQMKYDYENVMSYAVEQAAEKAAAEAAVKAEAKGLAEGEARGRSERDHEIAKNLRAIGLPLEQIIRATGLSKEEVQRL
jgi:predicted transposase/invertase (TIGR01784 family)